MLIVALVALRLGVGWHFFCEGSSKLKSGEFSSEYFLADAKGPLASHFKSFVWDPDGVIRLDHDNTEKAWTDYLKKASAHYQWDEEQNQQGQVILEDYLDRLEWFFEVNGEEIDAYVKAVEKRESLSDNLARQELDSLIKHSKTQQKDLNDQRGQWLYEIDQLWGNYEAKVYHLARPEQLRGGWLPLVRPGRRWLDSVTINQIIPYFDLAIGILLLAGFFTRTASLLGAAFLASVVVSQWPGSSGANPTHYQFIEMLALLVLAASNTGRLAGLDFFTGWLISRCCGRRPSNTQESKS